MKHLTATPVLLSLVVMVYGCSGGSDASGKKLSEVGEKCDISNLPIKVSFADTVIPSGESITKDNVCKAATDFSKFTADLNIKLFENNYGPNGQWCEMAKKTIDTAGSEDAAKQFLMKSSQDISYSDDERGGARMALAAIDLCKSAEARKKKALEIAATAPLRLYSVGSIKNPSNGKTCFAYLGETTYSSKGSVRANVPSLFAPDCGQESSQIVRKDGSQPNVTRGDWIKKDFGYTGAMPKTVVFQFNEVPFYSGDLATTQAAPPAQSKPVETITESEVRKFLTDQFTQDIASQRKANGEEGQEYDNAYQTPSIDKIFIGETELEKYPFAVVQVTRYGPSSASSDVNLMTKDDGKLRVFNTIGVQGQLETLEVKGQNITINSRRLGDNDPLCCPSVKHTDTYTYLVGDFIPTEDANQNFAKCLPSMPIHVPIINTLPYDIARKLLLAEGWQPIPQQESGIVTDGLRSKGVMEVENCAGTGTNPCIFQWKDARGDELTVHSQGEFDENGYPTVTSSEVTCKNPPPPVAVNPAPRAPAPMPMSGKDGAENAFFRLGQTIAAMESSPNPRCQAMANKLWDRAAKIDQLMQQGQMLEGRIGHDGGRYNQAILMVQQTETLIAQYGCSR